MKYALLAFCLMAALVPGQAIGSTFHLDPAGDDGNPGTLENPWKTLAKASQEAGPGDTVILLPGEYEGVLKPAHSGTPDSPITFRAARRRTVRLAGTKRGGHAIQIHGKSHISIEGLHIRPKWPKAGRWLEIADASYITVQDCLMEKAAGYSGLDNTPVVIRHSDQIRIEDSVLREFIGGNMANVYESGHIVIAGCAIGRAGHSPVAFSPRVSLLKSVENLVLRGNVFFAGWGRPFEIFGAPNVLFENNVIINAYHGARSAGPEAKMMMENGIVRFNRVYRNWGAPVNLGYYNPKADAKRSRWYNNVFDNNPQRAIRIETVEDYLFKNNILSRNGRFGSGRQLLFRGDAAKFRLLGNVFWTEDGAALLGDMERSGSGLTLEDVQSAEWRLSHGDQFRRNIETDPRFVDPVNYNHALAPESPLRDAGLPLAHTTSAGKGTLIRLDDVLYFYDGFGIEGEQGDLVAIGAADQSARVVEVDRQNRTLRIDHPVEWDRGDPVSLRWAGSAPDIGVYEHGETGRVTVQVVVEPFIAHPGQNVLLRAVVRGAAEPVSYQWQLGDGTVATTVEVAHAYDDVKGYPIRLKVTDSQGRIHRGTAFVDVQDPRRLEKPLLYTSFDNDPGVKPDFESDDGNWYHVYYKSRPTVDMRVVFDEAGNGVGRYSATFDDHPLIVTAYPAGWIIDQHPIVTFRYRTDPGLPLGVSIQAFSEIGEEGKVFVAVPPETKLAARRRIDSPQIVKNDGNWHEMTIDVRSIRERYPDATALQFLRFEATRPKRVKKGDGYWLDDVAILPDAVSRDQHPVTGR